MALVRLLPEENMATILEPLELESIDRIPADASVFISPPENTLACLVERAKSGDRTAWESLICRYQRLIYETVRARVRSDSDAEEVCQEVFLQAFRKLYQLEVPEAFGSWLRRIAERLAINHLNRRPSECSFSETQLERHRDIRAEPVGEAMRREAQQRVLRGLSDLRTIDREALVAFYLEGKSLGEISHELAVPLGTVKRRLHVARKRLAKILVEE
jgi:RNA polymerase sigma-70 factor (ECF subfamily)